MSEEKQSGIDWYMKQVNKPAGVGAPPISYEEFIEGHRTGRLRAGINTSRALMLQEAVPAYYLRGSLLLSWMWGLSIPILIIAAFFTYGIALVGLLVITPSLSRAAKKATANAVLAYALQERSFFEFLMSRNELLIEAR